MNPNNWRYWSSRGVQPPWSSAGRSPREAVPSYTYGPSSRRRGGYTGTEADLDNHDRLVQALAVCEVLLLYCIFISAKCFFMVKYQHGVVARKPMLSDPPPEGWRASAGNFRTSIRDECQMALNCLVCRSQDASLCLHSCCCLAVRMADTYASAGLGGFYCNFFMFFITVYVFPQCLGAVSGVRCGTWLGLPVLALGRTARRWQLQRRLGGAGGSWMDCPLLLVCGPCMACQEARHVDGALGVQVECCCVLMDARNDSLPLVGMPVTIN